MKGFRGVVNMYNKGYNKPLLIVAVIFTAVTLVLGLYFYTHGKSIPEPTGTVLTQEFMENYVHRRAYTTLGSSLLVGTFFWGGTIILALIWNLSQAGIIRKYAVTTAMIFFALVFPVLACGNSIPVLVNKPRVETVQVIGRFERHGRKHSTYRFRFTNGSSGVVSFAEYKDVPDRSKYYVIMCGNYCAGTFNADHYVDLS